MVSPSLFLVGPGRGNNLLDDIGRWSIDDQGRLCMTWNNWDGGIERCRDVEKKGPTLVMSHDGKSEIYRITASVSQPAIARGMQAVPDGRLKRRRKRLSP